MSAQHSTLHARTRLCLAAHQQPYRSRRGILPVLLPRPGPSRPLAAPVLAEIAALVWSRRLVSTHRLGSGRAALASPPTRTDPPRSPRCPSARASAADGDEHSTSKGRRSRKCRAKRRGSVPRTPRSVAACTTITLRPGRDAARQVQRPTPVLSRLTPGVSPGAPDEITVLHTAPPTPNGTRRSRRGKAAVGLRPCSSASSSASSSWSWCLRSARDRAAGQDGSAGPEGEKTPLLADVDRGRAAGNPCSAPE